MQPDPAVFWMRTGFSPWRRSCPRPRNQGGLRLSFSAAVLAVNQRTVHFFKRLCTVSCLRSLMAKARLRFRCRCSRLENSSNSCSTVDRSCRRPFNARMNGTRQFDRPDVKISGRQVAIHPTFHTVSLAQSNRRPRSNFQGTVRCQLHHNMPGRNSSLQSNLLSCGQCRQGILERMGNPTSARAWR
jgi:hypothetical protein